MVYKPNRNTNIKLRKKQDREDIIRHHSDIKETINANKTRYEQTE